MTARRTLPWAAAAAAATGLAAELAGLPAPWLLAGLLGGLTLAVVRGEAVTVPRAPTVAAQAVVGVAIGASIAPGGLGAVAGAWWVVASVVALSLGVSVAVALLLARWSDVDRATATMGMLPGAAPAFVAAGEEFGADSRLVATMQYGRVLLVVATVPAAALALGAGSPAPGAGLARATAPAGLGPPLTAASWPRSGSSPPPRLAFRPPRSSGPSS